MRFDSKLLFVLFSFISISFAWDSRCLDVEGHEDLTTPQSCEGVVLEYDPNNEHQIVFKVPGEFITKTLR